MVRPQRHTKGSSVFALYVLASLIPLGALGSVLVNGYHASGLEQARDQGRAQALVIEQMAIVPALSGADLSTGLSSLERGRLASATSLAIFNGTVSHLRLRTFSGAVVFSDDGSAVSSVPVSDPSFRTAATGGTDVSIVQEQDRSPAAIRVLRPVFAAANGKAAGVLEVDLPYDAIANKAAAETRRAIIRLTLGLLGLFSFLAVISWSTTRALRRYAADHEYQALHDSLTGLPNRELFRRKAEEALIHGRRGERGALVLIDLDHFKEVNDSLGHHAGDELLQIVARRLSESLRTDDIVARLGGDEFGLVLPRGSGREETVALLRKVRQALAAEVVLGGVRLRTQASFGLCFYPEGADTLEELLQHADAAMYEGKHGSVGVVVYEPSSEQRVAYALLIHRELSEALDGDELVLQYQPKIELNSGRVNCLEALLRWQHPERGLLLPAEFLSVAERSELIEPLTAWVLRRALADYTAWTAAGHDWTVAVNISVGNLTSPEFPESVCRILSAASVRPERLRLEMNESTFRLDVDRAGPVVEALEAQGISMAIDVVGIGHPLLSHQPGIKVSEVKIDRAIVADLPVNEHDRAIVRSVIDIGHSLGCQVTAQGVELREVADWLVEAGCDQAQGYLWLRPSSWTEVAQVFGGTTAMSVVNTH
jgi:diguanylate cyclase (GGDEF)-like protein